MRTLAVALSYLAGACATSGGGGFDPYGTYEFAWHDGRMGRGFIDWSNTWLELRADGRFSFGREQWSETGRYTLGEEEGGCVPIEVHWSERDTGPGSICGDVFIIFGDSEEAEIVFHKRR